jgi:hypothetical protein
MPKLVRFYIRHVAIGFVLAAVFVGTLVGFDVAGLGRLILGSPDWLLALSALWFLNAIVFGGVQFAVAIMTLDDGPKRGGGTPVAVPVRVEARRRDHQTKVRS